MNYPTTPDTSIDIGDRVKSFDFPGRTDCYAVGYVAGVKNDCYVIDVSEYVLEGDRVANPPKRVFPPVNGLEGLLGTTRGVVRV